MINVIFDYARNGKIQSFTMSGHADFAEHGLDIVCAGASAVSFGTVNAIMALADVEPEIEMEGDGGYLKCVMPRSITGETSDKVQLLLEAMLISLQTIERDYEQYIKITINK
ncbi:ribosomal-processing cysteine protease Prp [Peribacillus deserti]|uniref:Ribosomal processing cysteine protease Prp n=1 Tax=Peribacillus deserti TaxID=673318 RepID=A0A2N5M722_9BACI|nr:ribosomal-processing cysteine protease Prp [Peribacillus deserti]PLT30135.1 ribosomal-processing cysteine protease Prp [Peribacillus deserti]